MRKKIMTHMSILILSFSIWLIVPHFAGTIPAVISLCVSIICAIFHSKIKPHQQEKEITSREAKRLAYMLIAAIIMFLVIVMPGAFIVRYIAGRGALYLTAVMTVILDLLVLACSVYLEYRGASKALNHAVIWGFLAAITGLGVIFVMIDTIGYITLTEVILVVSLGISLSACATYLIPMNNDLYEPLWTSCFLAAIIITITLNMGLDRSQVSVIRYTAETKHNTATLCLSEEGNHFSYRGCPVPVGSIGEICQHEGWFHILYYTEMEE